MVDLSKLPSGITQVVDLIVVPVTMVWFVVRWFRLVPDDGSHKKALNATRKGCSVGIVGAVFLLFDFHYFYPQPSAGKGLSLLRCGIAVVFGIGAGILLRLAPKLPVDAADDARLLKRGSVVAAAIATGVAGLVLYYSYSFEYLVHQWLIFAFMTLLCVYRLSFLFGE